MSCCLGLTVAGSTSTQYLPNTKKVVIASASKRVPPAKLRYLSPHTHIVRISLPFFVFDYTHAYPNIPPSPPLNLPICYVRFGLLTKRSETLSKRKVSFAIQKRWACTFALLFYTALVYFITLGVPVLALPQSSNSNPSSPIQQSRLNPFSILSSWMRERYNSRGWGTGLTIRDE